MNIILDLIEHALIPLCAGYAIAVGLINKREIKKLKEELIKKTLKK